MFRAIRNLVSSFAFFAVLLPVLVWLAILSYISFYYSYIPVLHFTKPLHFLSSASHPYDLLAKTDLSGELLQPGVDYSIYLEMEVPESEINKQIGMFMLSLEIRSKSEQVIHSARKQTMLEYKSWLHSNLETVVFLPLYLFTNARQLQKLNILMMDDFREDTYRRSNELLAKIHTEGFQVYSASVHVYARFSGVRYLMYFWPLTTATFGVSTVFGFLVLVLLVSFLTHFRYRADRTPGPIAETTLPLKPEGDVSEESQSPVKLEGDVSEESQSPIKLETDVTEKSKSS